MGRVVLVTGVSSVLGGALARKMVEDPAVSHVIGVDVTPMRGDNAGVRFVRADIRNPVIAKLIAGDDVDTVIHTSVRPGVKGQPNKEHNVIGSMQLLAACQRAPSVERLIVKSSAEVYGCTNRDPAMFAEDTRPRREPRGGFAKDVFEVEGYVRGFQRRRPDVSVTTIRNATTMGAGVESPLTHYFQLAAIPKPVGFNARLQFLHIDDLLAVLHHAATAGVPGTFNVAGDGVLTLSQAIRRLGKPSFPVPSPAMTSLGGFLKPTGLVPAGFSAEQVRFLTYGRGLDTTRMREVLDFEPQNTTLEAFDDFATTAAVRWNQHHPVVALDALVTSRLGGSHG